MSSPTFIELPRSAAWPDPVGDDLAAHLKSCAAQRGRWFPLQCAAEAFHALVAPRFVTSLVAVFVVFGTITVVL
jgi:hypothetical protein